MSIDPSVRLVVTARSPISLTLLVLLARRSHASIWLAGARSARGASRAGTRTGARSCRVRHGARVLNRLGPTLDLGQRVVERLAHVAGDEFRELFAMPYESVALTALLGQRMSYSWSR